MNDAYFLKILAEQRQADFEREARLRRLRRTRDTSHPGPWAGACGRLGDLLIRTGQAVKSRYGPCACNGELHGGAKPCKLEG